MKERTKEENKLIPYNTRNCLSQLFFSYMEPSLKIANQRVKMNDTLHENDLYELEEDMECKPVLDRFRAHMLVCGGIGKAMFRTAKGLILKSGLLYLCFNTLQYVPPLVLNEILEYFEDEDRGDWYGYVLATVLFVSLLFRIFLMQHGFAKLNKVNVEMLCTMYGSIYEKTLKLSLTARNLTEVGKIINLFTMDSQTLANFSQIMHFLWSAPYNILICLTLIYLQIGWAGFVGLGVTIVGSFFQKILMTKWGKLRKEWILNTDIKTKNINEYIEGIRILKYYAWEQFAFNKIDATRRKEIGILAKARIIMAFNETLFFMIPMIMMIIVLAVYVAAGNEISSSKVYTVIALFNNLTVPLGVIVFILFAWIRVKVSVKRINAFMKSEEKQQNNQQDPSLKSGEIKINGNFAWLSQKIEDNANELKMLLDPRMKELLKQKKKQEALRKKNKQPPKKELGILETEEPLSTKHLTEEEKQPRAFFEEKKVAQYQSPTSKKNYTILKNINIHIKPGQLLAVVGGVGSGKSTFAHALIGELIQESGSLYSKGNIRFVPQQPWIINETLKNNIIMNEKFDQRRYKTVLNICELEKDIEQLIQKDETEIGSRGINLSGGQKQRVAIARAIYSDADIYIIDDALSALDAHVSKAIYNNVITGFLADKTRVLITHALYFLPNVKDIIVFKEGEIIEKGSYEELIKKNGEFFTLAQVAKEEENSDEEEEEEIIELNEEGRSRRKSTVIRRKSSQKKSEDNTMAIGEEKKGKLVEKEKVEVGKIKCSDYIKLLKFGGMCLTINIIIVFSISMGLQTVLQYVLGAWSEDAWDHSDEYYIILYSLLCLSTMALMFFGGVLFAFFSKAVALKSQMEMIKKIFLCPLWWFDITPNGRIINRCSKDQDTVDIELPDNLKQTLRFSLRVLISLLVVAVIAPIFIVIIFILSFFYYYIFTHSIQASRDTKRIESVSKSPIFSFFGESLEGLTQIRSSGYSESFKEKMFKRIDLSNKAFYMNFTIVRWMNLRVELLGALAVGGAAFSVLLMKSSIDSTLAGLCIVQSLQVCSVLGMMLRTLSENEIKMAALERIREYIEDTPSEKPFDEPKAPENWPTEGNVEITDLYYRYRKELDNVIKGISFQINSGEKIGVVGRTGSGKSTLTLGFLRIIEPHNEEGKRSENRIIIDGIDIEKIGLHQLRNKVAMIPQDPVLFSGTLKSNLDPFEKYSKEQLINALEKVDLVQRIFLKLKAERSTEKNQKKSKEKPIEKKEVNLEIESLDNHDEEQAQTDLSPFFDDIMSYPINEGGSNLSLGERQLVCLARAVIRDPKILIMDEATASIDSATDNKIQQMIHSYFKDITVITIAHRLKTIIDNNRILVLEAGKIIEYDAPINLINKGSGVFYELLKENGEEFFEEMKQIAQNSYSKNSSLKNQE